MHCTEPPSSSTLSISSWARVLDLVGERLDEVGAGERVHGVGGAGLVGDDLLRAQRDARCALGGQRQRLVEAVRVQRLGAAADGREALERHAHDVVLRLLGGQRHAAGLGVEAASSASACSRRRSARCMMRAHIRRAARNLATSWKTLLWPLKKNARRGPKSSTVEAGVDRGLHVGDPVGEREADLLHGRAALLAHVVAGDRDRVPLRAPARGSRRTGRWSAASPARAGR